MDNAKVIQINTWKGNWGIPSVDVECLQVLAYAKFANIPIRINPTSNPFTTPNGHLPVLKCGNKTLDRLDDIIKFLRDNKHINNCTLNSKQSSDLLAFNSMLREKLYPAIQFMWWIDQRNQSEVMRPWFSKAIPFPFNYYYVRKFEKEAIGMMESLYPTHDNNIPVIEKEIYSEAQKCINLLSTRLGDLSYFYGNEPTQFDAIVYSYLILILKVPLLSTVLYNHLNNCTNLVRFLTRITQKYFEDDYLEYTKKKAEETAKMKSDVDLPNKRRDMFFAVIVATFAMVGYALSTGMMEVSLNDPYHEAEDEDPDEEDDD